MGLYKTKKGFTLIEVLIALTVFMILITSVIGSYIAIARSQREANTIKEIYSDLRYVYSMISDEARLKTIDYSCYAGAETVFDGEESESYERYPNSPFCNDLKATLNPPGYSNALALIDGQGTHRTIFKIIEDSETLEKKLQIFKENREPNPADPTTIVDWIPDEGFQDFVTLDFDHIVFKDLNFQISPLTDPNDPMNFSCGPVEFQPAVSIYSSVGSKTDPGFELDLQTSITSRIYNKQTDIPFITN